MTPTGNLVLDALPEAELERLRDSLELLSLSSGHPIFEPDIPITHVYFPVDSVISMVSSMDGSTVEVGTVGCEGMSGVPILLHAQSMPVRAFVQVPGNAYRMTSAALRDALRTSSALERVLLRSAQALFDQVAQTAACNRLHTLEERCARWILMTHDRVGRDELALKHQFLAEMLGVHRPAVTLAAGALQRAGLIRYSRGKVMVLDRDGLESAACPCYAITKRAQDRLHVLGSRETVP